MLKDVFTTELKCDKNTYSYTHEMNPICNLSLQNLPLHFLDVFFTKPLHT